MSPATSLQEIVTTMLKLPPVVKLSQQHVILLMKANKARVITLWKEKLYLTTWFINTEWYQFYYDVELYLVHLGKPVAMVNNSSSWSNIGCSFLLSARDLQITIELQFYIIIHSN